MIRLPGPMRSAWVRTGFVSVIGVVLLVSLYVAGQAWENRNRGEGTTCPHFLKMSPIERAAVIDKMGYNPRYTSNKQQVARAVSGCRKARGTSDQDDALEQILGP